jgi:hypothetical protein
MTDRINAITVVLENDVRDDDVQELLTAIGMLRGVLSVTPNVSDIDAWIAQDRARHELGQKLLNIVYPKKEVRHD